MQVPVYLRVGELADRETKVHTDHMLIMTYHPLTGWSAPEIKPYGAIPIDPSSNCLQYATNVFEGMKVRYTSCVIERPSIRLTVGDPGSRRQTAHVPPARQHAAPCHLRGPDGTPRASACIPSRTDD
jgi:hypothetical protein